MLTQYKPCRVVNEVVQACTQVALQIVLYLVVIVTDLVRDVKRLRCQVSNVSEQRPLNTRMHIIAISISIP